MKNEFSLLIDGVEYFYNDVAEEIKYIFNTFYFRSNRVYEYPDSMISDNDKILWFELINFSGTPQDLEHLNNLKK